MSGEDSSASEVEGDAGVADQRPTDETAQERTSNRDSSGYWKTAGFVVAVLGIVLVAVTPNPPASIAHWVQVILGASITGFLTTFAGWYELVRRPPEWWKNWAGARKRARQNLVGGLVGAAIAVVLSAALAFGVPPAWDYARGVAIDIGGCAAATQLRMVASPETVTTARQLAGAYERWTAAENHGCPTADVYVYSVASPEIRQQLGDGQGWSDEGDALRELGPRPDVWLAATSHEIEGLGPAVASAATVAFSPVVVAVPQGVSNLQPRQSAGWGDVFRGLTDSGIPVVRADPDTSELGLLATTLLYGVPGPQGVASRQPLPPAEVEQRIDTALDDGGFPLTDTAGLLCRHRQAASAAAVVATEQDVARFNRGEPLGGACPAPADQPDRPLVALYPSDTRGIDLQLVRLAWSAPPQAQAAEAFGRWLTSDPGREAVMRSGLRPTGTFAVGPVLNTIGVDASVRPSEAPVPAAGWNGTADTYDQAQRRGRVLFAVDTSGSMAAVSPPEGTRSAVAARSVAAALQGMGPRDEFGLWLFPDASGAGHVDALPLGPGSEARLTTARQTLESVRPIGDTPLFRTVIDAAAVLGRPDQGRVDAVVVLTDGEDTSSGLGPEAVGPALGSVRLIVVTIGEVRCADSGLGTLAAQSGGECLDADLATLDRTLGRATAGLWGGR